MPNATHNATPLPPVPSSDHQKPDDGILSALAQLIRKVGYDLYEVYIVEGDRGSSRLKKFISSRAAIQQEKEPASLSEPNAISKAIKQNYPQIEAVDPETGRFSFNTQPESWAKSAICLPIGKFIKIQGVLVVYSNAGVTEAYKDMDLLQSCATLAEPALFNSTHVQSASISDYGYEIINQATINISEVDTVEEIINITLDALNKSPYLLIHLAQEYERLNLRSIYDPDSLEGDLKAAIQSRYRAIESTEIEKLLPDPSPRILQLDNRAEALPREVFSLLSEMNIRNAAFLPVWDRGTISDLFILGTKIKDGINPISLQPYTLLVGYAATSIEKIQALHHLQRRVSALQSIASVSQAISMVTNLDELYETIHEKITQVMGEIDLIIAIYNKETDMISIPYAHEAGQNILVESFPLGQGLTSILIRTQQPLMLVEDTERRAMELGAKVAGAPAKSWLGVPLIVSGEVIGAIIVQDIDREHRFDNDDLRLLTTLSSQVAITIRNVRLLEETKRRAERERRISEISRKIWASPDIETIASTTVQELGQTMKASRATFHLGISTPDSDGLKPGENQK